MRRAQQDRDPIKEFIMSVAPRLEGVIKSGLPARNRPGFSEKTRSKQTRRSEAILGTQ
ncbi:hypothetical protein AMST5_03476 [freshwater sediment metagenome]|jgi:hypothetical protein|uniref:Uncharacterized protein n=1 Tax=freshwater sediment metagenome TaxID=556182 RepID=A0AA48M5B6_9ZZZZ